MRRIVIAMLLALTGCTTARVTEMPTPNGSAGLDITCNGTGNTWAACYKAAAEHCPAGYAVLDRTTDAVRTRDLVVQCAAHS